MITVIICIVFWNHENIIVILKYLSCMGKWNHVLMFRERKTYLKLERGLK